MRNREHSNKFKRLRAQVNQLVAAAAGKVVHRKLWKYAVYQTIMVPSRRYSVTVDGEEHKNRAIQVRMQQGSPRKIYQEAKHKVSFV